MRYSKEIEAKMAGGDFANGVKVFAKQRTWVGKAPEGAPFCIGVVPVAGVMVANNVVGTQQYKLCSIGQFEELIVPAEDVTPMDGTVWDEVLIQNRHTMELKIRTDEVVGVDWQVPATVGVIVTNAGAEDQVCYFTCLMAI